MHTVAENRTNGAVRIDIEELRTQLARRAAACLDRLDDVVSELVALHAFHVEEIIARVRATADAEERAAGESAPT